VFVEGRPIPDAARKLGIDTEIPQGGSLRGRQHHVECPQDVPQVRLSGTPPLHHEDRKPVALWDAFHMSYRGPVRDDVMVMSEGGDPEQDLSRQHVPRWTDRPAPRRSVQIREIFFSDETKRDGIFVRGASYDAAAAVITGWRTYELTNGWEGNPDAVA
jgi:hypothetical protein